MICSLMPDTTLEEAKRCPICKEPGSQTGKTKETRENGRKANVLQMTCMNEACRWFNTNWIIQVNADGSIPTRTKADKEFDNSSRMVTMGERYIERIKEETQRSEYDNRGDR